MRSGPTGKYETARLILHPFVDLRLSTDEIERLSQAFPPGVAAGARYPEKQLRTLGI